MKLARITDPQFTVALSRLTNQPMPLRTAFKLKGIISRVREEQKKFEDVRQEALNTFGSKGEDGQLQLNENRTVQFTQENLQLFANQLNELGEVDVDIGSVSLAELGDKVVLSPDEAATLDGLLSE